MADPSPTRVTVELALSGMHCRSCVELIQDVLVEQTGVFLATVVLDSESARVEFDPSVTTVDDLCAAVLDTGYSASLRAESSNTTDVTA